VYYSGGGGDSGGGSHSGVRVQFKSGFEHYCIIKNNEKNKIYLFQVAFSVDYNL